MTFISRCLVQHFLNVFRHGGNMNQFKVDDDLQIAGKLRMFAKSVKSSLSLEKYLYTLILSSC